VKQMRWNLTDCGVTPGVKSTTYDACAEVIRSPQPSHRPPPEYSPRAAPQRTERQSSCAQGRPDGERHCACAKARATRVRVPTSPSRCSRCRRRDANRGPRGRANGGPARKYSSEAGKPVAYRRLVTFRLVCLGRDVPTALPSANLSILVSLTNQEAGLTCLVIHLFVSTLL